MKDLLESLLRWLFGLFGLRVHDTWSWGEGSGY